MNNTTMIIIMLISGLFSTMNLYADKLSDINWSLNDLYMSLSMTGWMLLLSGLYMNVKRDILLGCVFIFTSFICIRKQLFITEAQYYKGMIPHHSMAVHMSKKLLENHKVNNEWFIDSIIKNQSSEIDYMKKLKF